MSSPAAITDVTRPLSPHDETRLFWQLRLRTLANLWRHMLSEARLRFTLVVVLSVVGELKYLGEAYQRGANSFLIKPLAASDLLETVRAIPSLVLNSELIGIGIRPTGWTELPPDLPTFIPPLAIAWRPLMSWPRVGVHIGAT